MPVTVKSISLWRRETRNKTGHLAQTLDPPGKAGGRPRVVMGWREISGRGGIPGTGPWSFTEVLGIDAVPPASAGQKDAFPKKSRRGWNSTQTEI